MASELKDVSSHLSHGWLTRNSNSSVDTVELNWHYPRSVRLLKYTSRSALRSHYLQKDLNEHSYRRVQECGPGRARACLLRMRIPIFCVPCARARKAPCGPTAPAINEPWTNINDPVPSFPVKINISHCITMLQFLGWHNNNIWRQQENI